MIDQALADLEDGAKHLLEGYRAVVKDLQDRILVLEARLDERRLMNAPAETAAPEPVPVTLVAPYVEPLQLVQATKRKRYDQPPKKTLKPCAHAGCTRTFVGTKFKKYCDPCYPIVLRERAAARWQHSNEAREIDMRIAVNR